MSTHSKNIKVSFLEQSENNKSRVAFNTQRESQSSGRLVVDVENFGTKSNYSAKTLRDQDWKKKTSTCYETLVLTKTAFNSKVQGAGFKKTGKFRKIKRTCLLSKI